MDKRKNPHKLFDPHLEQLKVERETSSDRIRAKLNDPIRWCFCELCWRTTEYSITLDAHKVFKPLLRSNLKVVPITSSIRALAQRKADKLVSRYERAWAGELGKTEPFRMLLAYCNMPEMNNDFSATNFREQVERSTLLTEWKRQGILLRPSSLPGQPEGSSKPSKLYCEDHNPRRSDESRRAYQRDRRFITDFEELISSTWTEYVASLPMHDIESHAFIRKEAYKKLQHIKSPTKKLDDLLALKTMSQAKIAETLGISRQAVSAAIKRKKNSEVKP